MPNRLDTSKLSKAIRQKRGRSGLREIGKEINVSASTLSRIEKGNLPDIETYLILCEWLGVSTDFFTLNSKINEGYNLNSISAHFRADKTLKPETANALIEMIKLAYRQANG